MQTGLLDVAQRLDLAQLARAFEWSAFWSWSGVFAVFATLSMLPFKQMGIGLAAAS